MILYVFRLFLIFSFLVKALLQLCYDVTVAFGSFRFYEVHSFLHSFIHLFIHSIIEFFVINAKKPTSIATLVIVYTATLVNRT